LIEHIKFPERIQSFTYPQVRETFLMAVIIIWWNFGL